MENIVLPSLLSANFYDLKSDIETLDKLGCKALHIDVMDGMFVPNYAIGIPVIKSIRANSDMILDCHLMTLDPIRYIEDFAKAGADIITIHTEATNDIIPTLELIKSFEIKSALSVKPKTDISEVFPYIQKGLVDMILVMSVEPGFGGQGFITDSLDKISELKKFIDEGFYNIDIEVDGGICKDNIALVKDSGANMLVAGSAVFKGDIKTNFETLNNLIK